MHNDNENNGIKGFEDPPEEANQENSMEENQGDTIRTSSIEGSIKILADKTKEHLKFFVQKHLSTRLHYDFRLEFENSLKSWIVPKGPSMSPLDERLAVEEECHPLDYGTFEGVVDKDDEQEAIILWDQGVLKEKYSGTKDSSDKALRAGLLKGHIQFLLLGTKLKGEFSLVRLQETNSWLLLKKEDEFADMSSSPTLDEQSILTSRVIEDLINENPSEEPSYEEPSYEEPSYEESEEPSYVESEEPTIESPINSFHESFETSNEVPEIKQKNEFYPGNKRDYIDSDNNKIENLISPIKMMLPIKKKEVKFGEGWYFYQKEPCFRAIAEINSGQVLCYSSHQISFKKTFLTICENLKKLNKNMIIEGEIIVKRTNSSEASEKLLRQYHREPQGVEVFKITDIIGFEEKNLRNTAYWRRLKILETIDLPEGIELKKIDEKFDPNSSGPYYAKHSNSKYKSGVSTAFVDFKVEDENDGESGQLLHNDWKKIEKEEKDKPIGKFERARFNELRSNDYCQIEKGPLITNLSRVLWPDEQYSKDDLYEYYKKVSKVIIKYLKYRPLALMRYPRGINGGGFFQKDLTGYTPSWLETIKMRSKSKGVINYPLCQNENSLLYLVNMCCIEFKPWLTMVNDLYCPKEIVINVTGKSRDNFDQVIEVAQNFYDTLKRLNIETFCKTNGDDGLNIVIPLIAEYKYTEVRNFAKKLCEIVHNKIPDLTQLEGSISGNEGASKIMLDYMQNCYGQSVIAPYSVRAVPNANVSAPVFWSEVKSGLSPDQFNIKTMIPRLEKLGDIWEPRHEFAYDVIDCMKKLPNAS